MCGKFCKDGGYVVSDNIIGERSATITLIIAELLYKTRQEYIENLQYDLAMDNQGQLYFIKLTNLSVIQTLIKLDRNNHIMALDPHFKKRDIKITQQEENNDEDKKLLNVPKQRLSTKKETNKNFIELVAKTFERDRHNKLRSQKLHEKKRSLLRHKSDQKLPLIVFDDKINEENEYNSIKDLLSYIETTRISTNFKDGGSTPKSQTKMNSKSPIIFKSFDSKFSDLLVSTPNSRNLPHSSSPFFGSLTPKLVKHNLLQQYMEERDNIYSYKYPDVHSALLSPIKTPEARMSPSFLIKR